MNNTISKSLAVLAVGGLMFLGSPLRNKTIPLAPAPARLIPDTHGVNQVNQCETNQQNRIANGVKNGQLTPGQTARLERGEQRLQNNEKRHGQR